MADPKAAPKITAAETIMPVAELRKLLGKSKQEPVSAAVGLTAGGEGVILLVKAEQAQPRRVLQMLKSKAGKTIRLDAGSLRFGTAVVDPEISTSTVTFTVNKEEPGNMALKLRNVVKEAFFNKVVFAIDPSLGEEEGGEEEGHDAPAPGQAEPPKPSQEKVKLVQALFAARRSLEEARPRLKGIAEAEKLLAQAEQAFKSAAGAVGLDDLPGGTKALVAGIGLIKSAQALAPVPPGKSGQAPVEPMPQHENRPGLPGNDAPPPLPQRMRARPEELRIAIGKRLFTSEKLVRGLGKLGSDASGEVVGTAIDELTRTSMQFDAPLRVPCSEVDKIDVNSLFGDFSVIEKEFVKQTGIIREALERQKQATMEYFNIYIREAFEIHLKDDGLNYDEENESDREMKENFFSDAVKSPDQTVVDHIHRKIRDKYYDLEELEREASKIRMEGMNEEEKLKEEENLSSILEKLIDEQDNELSELMTEFEKNLSHVKIIGKRMDMLEKEKSSLDWMASEENRLELENSLKLVKEDPGFPMIKDKLSILQAMQLKNIGISFSDYNHDDLDGLQVIETKKLGGGAQNKPIEIKFGDNSSKVFKKGKPGDNSTGRNIAARDISELLGSKVIVDCKVTNFAGQVGLMMDTAPGRAAGKVGKEFTNNFSKQNLASLQEQLCELEWSDILMAQEDRKNDNYFIEVKSDSIKVTGIDNDNSFHENFDKPEALGSKPGRVAYRGTGLPQVISRKMYDKLMDETFIDNLKERLQGRITEKELNATINRALGMRQHAMQLAEKKYIVDDDWSNWKSEADGKNATQILLGEPSLFSRGFTSTAMLKRLREEGIIAENQPVQGYDSAFGTPLRKAK